MSWIYYDIQEDKVVISPEALKFDQVAKIYNKDRRNDGKPYFNKVIAWVWHCYYPDHALSNHSSYERKKRVKETYFQGVDIKNIENDKDVHALVELYMKDVMTPSQRFYEDLKKDMSDTLEYIRSIPMYHEIKHEIVVDVELPDEEGKMKTMKAKAKVPLRIDNSSEKMKAMSTAHKLMDLEESLKIRIKKEKKSKKGTKRLFDET